MRIAVLTLVPLALGVACAKSSSAPSTQPLAVPAPPASVRVVRIDPDAVRFDDQKKTVVYRPGRNVKRARYMTYHFDYQEFRRFAGDKKPVSLRVEVLKDETKTVQPPAGGSAPAGGFRIRHLTCRILGKAS